MTLRSILNYDCLVNDWDCPLANSPFDAVSVGAGANLGRGGGSTYSGQLFLLRAVTGGSSVVAYGEIDWGYDDAEIYGELYVYFENVPSAITAFFSVLDSVPTQLFSLRVAASGYFQLYDNANSTAYTSTTNKVIQNTKHRIEFYWKTDASTGAFTVKIDGHEDPALTQTGLNNGAALPRRYRLGVVEAQANAGARYFSGVLICAKDSVGYSDWFGPTNISLLALNGTDAGGGNWTVVDSGKADWQVLAQTWDSQDNNLIKSSSANQEDRMKLGFLGGVSDGVTILGMLSVIRHRRTTAGSAAGVNFMIRSGGVDGTSTTFDAGGTTWTTKRGALQLTDPNTAAAWTVAAVNAALLKIVHDAGTNECSVNGALVWIAWKQSHGIIYPTPLLGTLTKWTGKKYGMILPGPVTASYDNKRNRKA
jgi:hypothetical protein